MDNEKISADKETNTEAVKEVSESEALTEGSPTEGKGADKKKPLTPEEMKKRQKKKALAFLCTVLSLLIILPIISVIDWNALFGLNKEDDRTAWPEKYFFDEQYFYEADYDENIEEDAAYMEKDRSLYYTRGNETFQVLRNPEDYGTPCILFYQYFENLKNGNYRSYYSFFTDEYRDKTGNVNPFTDGEIKYTAQKVYNIKVVLLDSIYLEDGDENGNYKGSTIYKFDVEYCIKDNNGTFRRDIRSNESRWLVFTVIETNGKSLINDITFHSKTNKQ